MEPISLITGAIAAGAANAIKETATQTVKNSYQLLKSYLSDRFLEKGKPEGELALIKYEEKPTSWESAFRESLLEIEADKDENILNAAKDLIESIRNMPDRDKAIGKFILKNSEAGIVGDYAKVEGDLYVGKK